MVDDAVVGQIDHVGLVSTLDEDGVETRHFVDGMLEDAAGDARKSQATRLATIGVAHQFVLLVVEQTVV